MDPSDGYKSVKGRNDFEIKVKGSKFIGRTRPALTSGEAEARLEQIRKKYYDATHNCYAYRVGQGKKEKFRYSDDGEPSGTAGRPIYDQIVGHDLTNILVVVTRYFGGTKLGPGGLARAYSEAAGGTIDGAEIVEKYITRTMVMTVQFSDYNNVENLINQMGGILIGADYKDIVSIRVEIRRSMADSLRDKLTEITSGRIKFG
jgi:uncharacterized YigZ family protein